MKGARIGIVEHLFGCESVHREVNDVIRSDIDRMREAGAVIVAINDPAFNADKLVAEVSVHLSDLKPDLNNYLSNPKRNTPVRSLEEIIGSGKFAQYRGGNKKGAVAEPG